MSDVSLPLAFGLGVAAFTTSCVLPLVPIYLANLGGVVSLSAEIKRRTLLLHTISFIIGFSVVYVILGSSVGLIGMFIPQDILRIVGGVTLIVFGIYFLVALKVPKLNMYTNFSRPFWGKVGYMRSTLMGVVFSVGIGPCTPDKLGIVLTWAGNSQTAWKGASYLLIYSLGLGLPFIIVALALGSAQPVLRWLRRRSRWISIISSIMLIVIGSLMLANIIKNAA
jgi:cytochrome c-type biogenesis protein